MSVSKLSDTLQRRIMENLINSISSDINKVNSAAPGKRFGSTFIKTTITESNVTRLLTDPNQTGIFGKTGLKELADGFQKIADTYVVSSRVLGKDGQISKQAGYKNLKSHLKKTVEKSADQVQALKNEVKVLAIEANKLLSDPNLYDNFLQFVKDSGKYTVEELESDTFAIRATEHGTINKLFEQFLLSKSVSPHIAEFISANTDAGHLLGIFNQKLFRGFLTGLQDTEYGLGALSVDIFKNIEDSEKENKAAISDLNNTFSAAFNLMEYVDLLSSSFKTTPDIFVKLSKEVYVDPNNPKAAAEIQINIDNSDVGRKLSTAGDMLKKLIESAKNAKFITVAGSTSQVRDPKSAQFAKQLETLLKEIGSLAKIAKELAAGINTQDNKLLQEYVKRISQDADKFGDILFNAEGSDSVKTAIEKRVRSILSKEKLPQGTKTSVNKSAVKKTGTTKKAKVSSPKAAAPKTSNKNISADIKKPSRQSRNNTIIQTNLISLQNIINQELASRLEMNMGTGARRDILNYRTGRFANSVKVERMSQSRQGMITAFYSYMKNPYATFSEGGQQEFPRTRDPKLLISKSIREIAASKVENRLRAVLI